MKRRSGYSPVKTVYVSREDTAVIAAVEQRAKKEGISFSKYVIAGLRLLLGRE